MRDYGCKPWALILPTILLGVEDGKRVEHVAVALEWALPGFELEICQTKYHKTQPESNLPRDLSQLNALLAWANSR